MVPAISTIICTYNRAQSLSQTLASMAEMIIPTGMQWELIVIDNNSTDSTRYVVEQFIATSPLPLKYVFEPHPGLSYARNAGIQHSQGSVIAFTDDDVRVEKHWLANLNAAFQNFDCIAIGGRIYPVWPGPMPSWFQERGPFATPKAIVYFDLGDTVCVPSSHPYGANMAFRREAFAKYGEFRVDLGRVASALMGGEDIEFFERLRRSGESVLYIPDVVVYHPVTNDRMEKRYFESWCFNASRSSVRFEGLPERAIYYFGVPRFYFRNLLENLALYLLTLDSDRRFYYKLQIYSVAGRIVETRRLTKSPATKH